MIMTQPYAAQPTLREQYLEGRAAAFEYALSKIKDSIIADDIPDDLHVPESRAWHNGWNSNIRQARETAYHAVADLRDDVTP
jgi:hypothetical protein